MEAKEILKLLRARRFRITKGRTELIRILCGSHRPLTAMELKAKLEAKSIKVNKTTVYREVEFLKNEGLLSEVDLGDQVKRYELHSDDHRHHLVCVKCHKVEDIILEGDLAALESHIHKTRNFQVLRHSLEFFGLCASCG